MNHMLLLRQLQRVGWRYRQLRLWQFMALVWLGAAALGLLLWMLRPVAVNPLPVLLALACAGLVSAAYWAWRSARDPLWIARQIEATFPELRTCLLAALELQPDLPNGRYGYLQGRVIYEALTHSRLHRWANIISAGQLLSAVAANAFSFFAFLSIAALLATSLPPQRLSNFVNPLATTPLTERIVTVEPGDTEVERGTSLLVLARVQGPMPAEGSLVVRNAAGEETTLPMSASLEDPVFAGRIPIVDQALTYHVAMAGQNTPSYRVQVFEYPRLERADAALEYPAYTGLESRVVQDVRTVSVVEGTELTLQCFLNKPVATAQLLDTRNNSAAPVELAPSADDPCRYEASWSCTESRRFQLELIDDAGRTNQKTVQFSVNVRPNQPPNVKVVFPAKDLEVSPLEELDLRATVWDDFGVRKLGLTYSLAGAVPVDVVLLENASAKDRHEIAHRLALENLAAEPDQLLSYYWWAEDIGPDGQPRQVFSDMYFAEVRPFEEIFRQGDQPTAEEQRQQQQQNQQGEGQNAQDAQELAKLQKDIINATWKLIRRETTGKPTAALAADAEQVQLSQESVLEQATSLAERVTDEQSAQHVEDVLTHMQAAAEQLKLAAVTPASEPLRPALSAAQQAYQSLLKLRAREHEVVRQQQQRQQGQQSSQQQNSARSQQQRQQMNELDLRNDENRYETERTAQEQQQESAEDRENRQVQNRLRELARRQGDVNDRLKELQSALEEARTEEQKEEIRRQLQRLQDEQQQILQDTDELQSRLDRPENAERMADEQRQLDETRDQVRRASEALEQQRVTQAAAAGTRAEQQFEELREEFRRRSANRFNEEMQNLRQQAQQLEEQEQNLAEQLQQTQPGNDGPPTLRDEGADREQLAERIDDQQQRLEDLQERMRNTIGEAEESEPLLSQRLYDAVRNVQDRRIDQSLEQAERAVRQGLPLQAQQQEARAAEGVRELREAVDRAAEAVLGDETEALRRAREELRELSRELNDEIQRNDPAAARPEQGEPANQEQNPGARENGQPGEQRNPSRGEPASEERNSGERQTGQSSNDRGQPGEQTPMKRSEPSSQQPGEQSQSPGEQSQQPGEQPGQQSANQPGQGQNPGQRGEPSGSQQQQPPGENQRGQQQPGQRGQQPGQRQPGGTTAGSNPQMGANFQGFAPLTGEDFREWSDRLRDVEEMVDDPELRAEAARIRERARAIRAEHKRHSAEPNWDLVQEQVAGPLVELQDRVAEELLRRTTKKALVPLDRDPVPPQYSEKTRKYYEQLGSGK